MLVTFLGQYQCEPRVYARGFSLLFERKEFTYFQNATESSPACQHWKPLTATPEARVYLQTQIGRPVVAQRDNAGSMRVLCL